MFQPAPLCPPANAPAQITGLGDILHLTAGRAHEACGPARRVLALWLIALLAPKAPILWLRPRWNRDRLYPSGFAPWTDPGRLILAHGAKPADLLACAEDGLRSGACGFVVVDLADPPALTPLRRLHLAASEGLGRRRTRMPDAGLHALVLTPGQGGAAGVESRWHMAPCPAPAQTDLVQPAWRLERLRARMAPPAQWQITAGTQAQGWCSPVDKLRVQRLGDEVGK